MATPHEDIKPPTLEFVYRLEFQVGDPVIVPAGPKGSRYIFPILTGTFEGADPDFRGTIAVPSADFAIGHSDGSGVTLKVNIIMKTHDGATILGIAEGRSKRDPNNPVNAEIQIAKTFETGDERYKWMNNEVFIGSGVKLDKKIKLNYYRKVIIQG